MSTIGKIEKGKVLFAEKRVGWNTIQSTAKAWFDGRWYCIEIVKQSGIHKLMFLDASELKAAMRAYCGLKQWKVKED